LRRKITCQGRQISTERRTLDAELLVGVAVRFAAFWGAVQMVLFRMSHLQGGLLAGFPIEHGRFVSSHVVYALLLFGLGAAGAGRILGLDEQLEATSVVENNRWLRYLLG
jgi:thiosulfate dehydrogenase [quinone] large subunit